MFKKFFYLTYIFFSFSIVYSQKSIVATGGKAFGNGGTAAFSVGQISYKSPNGNIVSDGVQQPYEIVTLGKSSYDAITLKISVFPNPTPDALCLKIDKLNDDLFYQLFDANGKLLSDLKKIVDPNTIINFNIFEKGIFFINIKTGNQTIKTFKIIKK